jgi:hypothetical protein
MPFAERTADVIAQARNGAEGPVAPAQGDPVASEGDLLQRVLLQLFDGAQVVPACVGHRFLLNGGVSSSEQGPAAGDRRLDEPLRPVSRIAAAIE